MLILCVDDERLVRSITSDMLRELGHDVMEAEDGLSALDSLARCGRAIDLMMADVRMPGMTGFSLVRKAQIEYPNLGIIYMTGYSGGPTTSGTMVQKPCTLGRLDQVMKTAERAMRR